jgi:hypothetical protein
MQHVSFTVMQGPFYPKRSDRSYFIIQWQSQRTRKLFLKTEILFRSKKKIGPDLESEWTATSYLFYSLHFVLASKQKHLKLQ